jgi:hypothetical protein
VLPLASRSGREFPPGEFAVLSRHRIQCSLTLAELAAIDNWRFEHREPSRAAAVRRLLGLGLRSKGKKHVERPKRSQDFPVLDQTERTEDERTPARLHRRPTTDEK